MVKRKISTIAAIRAVLDRNLFDVPSSEISDAKVTMTVFDGRTVYQEEEDE